MEKLFRLVDVSLVTTVVSGLLYVLGYNYFLYYYAYFGINLLVRDPDIAYVFTKGFDFSGFLLGIILGSVVVFMTVDHLFRFTQEKFHSLPPQQGKSVALVLSLCAFMFAFTSLLDYVQYLAEKSAIKLAIAKQSGQAAVILQDGNKLPGSYSFFFLNKNHVVLFNTSGSAGKKPKLTIIPSGNVKYLEIN